MENKFNLQAALWIGCSCFIAAVLAVNGVQALRGLARFASWQLATLTLSVVMAATSMTASERSRCLAFLRLMRIKAAKHSRTVFRRAIRVLASSIVISSPKIQTEP